jgi:protoporphyrinogen oxidase
MKKTNKPVCILGGGLSALSYLYYSRENAVLIEKEDRLGGLCRSYNLNGISYDIGPHIFFSQDADVLHTLVSLAPMHIHRRSNRILFKAKFVKYPFENELSALPPADRDWCLKSFLNNPYTEYKTNNMLQFFYTTFGEGIIRSYIEPYNRKIWKFEPSFMDTQMVDRIPRPPREDIIASAKGKSTEGYLHQLYFHYPDSHGAESIIQSLANTLIGRGNCRFMCSTPLKRIIIKSKNSFKVFAGNVNIDTDKIVTTLPIQELIPCIEPTPPVNVINAMNKLKFNSIHITVTNVKKDNLGDNFAVMIPDPDISFHRVSKIDFLGVNYHLPHSSTIMTEITYRKGGMYDLPDSRISEIVIQDLHKTGLVRKQSINNIKTLSFKYAYVIYDLEHRRNVDIVLKWLESKNITSIGRFAEFEYINMDKAMSNARDKAYELTKHNTLLVPHHNPIRRKTPIGLSGERDSQASEWNSRGVS